MTEVATQQITEWIEKNLIPKIAKALGKSSDNARWDINIPEDTIFLSCVYFLELTFEPNVNTDLNKNDDKLSLVIKRPSFNNDFAKKMNMTVQFHNEILFYTKVAKENPRFARCIFVSEETPEDTAIVIENIITRGYELCSEGYDIPFDYVITAISEIARLHAMGYIMKEKEPEELKKIVENIQEARYIPDKWTNEFLNIVSSRPVPWLRRNNVDAAFCDKIERYLDNAFNDVMLAAVKPVEPLATLCHGDSTRNNTFFRKVDGKLEAMLIDFALMGYSSPGIDIATFLYLHCSTHDRIKRFDEIFKCYHETLIGCLREAGISDMEKYSYENVLNEYKRTAAFGYVIAVYFLPFVRDPSAADITLISEDHKAGARKIRAMGGENLDELFGKMILELRDRGCFDHVY